MNWTARYCSTSTIALFFKEAKERVMVIVSIIPKKDADRSFVQTNLFLAIWASSANIFWLILYYVKFSIKFLF